MKRRSRKWLRRAAGALVVLVALRIGLTLALPGLIELGARSIGLTSRYENARLSVLRGSLVVEKLALRPRAGDDPARPPALAVEHACVDLAMLALLRGTVRVQRAELDGAELYVERDANGVVDWLARLAPRGAGEPRARELPAPLDFTPPIELNALRVQSATLHVVDHAVTPPFEARVRAHVRVSDVGSTATPATWRVDVDAPGLLEHARIEGSGAARGVDAHAACDVELVGLALEPIRAELANVGLAPDGRMLSARARVALATNAVAGDAHACAVDVRVADAHVDVDGEVRAELGSAMFALASVKSDALRGARVDMRDGEIALERRAKGELALLGLRFVGSDIGEAQPETSESPALHVDLAGATLGNCALSWLDETTTPHATTRLNLTSADVGAWDPDRPDALTHATFDLEAAGLAGRVRGAFSIRGAPSRVQVTAEVNGTGATFADVAPYLAAIGLAPELANGTWTARADVNVERAADKTIVSGELGPLRLSAESELAAVERVKLAPSSFAEWKIDCGRIEVAGVRLAVRRSPDGSVHALGVRTTNVGPVASAQADVPSATTTQTTVHSPLRADFAEIEITDIALRAVDEVNGGLAFDTTGTRLKIENLGFGGTRGRDPQQYGRVRGRFALAPVLGEMTLEGELIGKPGPLDLETKFTFRANTIDARPLAPYLEPFGIEPELAAGAFRVQVDTHLKREGAATNVRVQVRDFELVDGKRSLVQLDRAGGNVLAGAHGAQPTALDFALGNVDVTREADGSVRALGLRFRTPPPSQGATEIAAPVPLAVQLDALTGWPALDLGDARVSASVRWRDLAVAPPVDWTVRARADVRHATIGPGARTSEVTCELEVRDVVKSAKLALEGELDPRALHVVGRFDVAGVNGAALAPYLSRGARCELASGTASGRVELTLAHPDAATWSASAALLDVRAGETGAAPFLELGEARISVPAVRFDAEHGDVVEIDRVALAGLRALVKRTADGKLHAFGISLDDDAGASVETSRADTDVTPSASETAGRGAPPTVRLNELELALAELRVDDETRGANAEPIVVAATLSTPAPVVLAAPSLADAGTLELQLVGAASPLATFSARLSVTRGADPITFALAAELGQLRGAALAAFVPELADTLDVAASMHDGVARLALTGQLQTGQHGSAGVDVARGFGAKIDVNTLELRAAPDLAPLAGIEAVHVDVERVDPRTGDVRVKSVEVVKPFAHVERHADGLHALGLVFRAPRASAAAEPAVAATTAAVETKASDVQAAADTSSANGAASTRASVVSIERITFNGLDATLRDDTGGEPVELALTGLDAEVRRFTTRAFSEPVPIAFEAFVSAGDVELPARVESASLLAGVANATGRLVAGVGDEKQRERRALFDEIAVRGRITLAPQPQGWITLDVGALELAPLGRLAADSGVELGDGVLDQSVRIRLQAGGGFTIESTSAFDHLRVAEAPDGPISRYLALPAPLDTVLFLLEDAEGRHRVPITVHVTSGAPSRGEVVKAVASAAASVIARAVASSPLRVVGGVGGLLGLDAETEARGADVECITFDAGGTELAPETERVLARAAAAVSDDAEKVLVVQHTFCAGDVARAAELANPPAADVRGLVERLRARRAELVRDHDRLAAEARVHGSVGRADSARAATEELREVDAELAGVDDALDRAGELLRPNADKKRDARTRAAALRIASERMDVVKRRLVELGVPAERVELRRARVESVGERGELALVPKRRG